MTKTPARRRVLLVEDHPTVRAVLEILVNEEPSLEVVGSTGTVEGCIDLVAATHPDVIVLDHDLAGPSSGTALAPRLKDVSPDALVLMCTSHDVEAQALAQRAVDGFLGKDHLVDLASTVVGLTRRQ
jgi:DNA-binding NarL/FixJ family response regulator